MAILKPEWLARHGGEVRPAAVGGRWIMYFDNQPQYVLVPTPVTGKFGCEVTQSINGKRIVSAATHATAEAALQSGLEDVRKVLGW